MSKIFDALKQAELASHSRSRLAATRKESVRTVFVIHATDPVDNRESETRTNKGLNRRGASHFLIGFFLGVLLISASVIFLRPYARGVGDNRQPKEIMAAVKVPGILSPGSTVEQPTTALPATLSSNLPGLVLQVAAMKHKENADALAETLHHRNFPVFVYKRGTSTFFLVAVGVYGDVDSARRVKDELERQGFKSILRRWLSE